MAARNTYLQTQFSQLTQQLSQPSPRELELVEAKKALKARCEALQEKSSALLESRDETRTRDDSLSVELATC